MNNIILTGNLTKDSELSFVGDKQTPKLSFTLANNEGYGDNKKSIFVNCVLWGSSAEKLQQHLNKGTKILVKGKLDIRSYEKDGEKKWLTEVVADMFGGIEFIGGKNSNSQGGGNYESSFEEPVDYGDMPF